MKKTEVLLSIFFMALMAVSLANAANETGIGCQNLYWVDDDNRECGQKQFCGAYMYYGLFTFENETECQNYVLASSEGNSNNNCTSDSDCVQTINMCGDPTGPNYQSCMQNQRILKCIDNKCKTQPFCPSNSEDENGKCMFTLSNGRKAEIKIMPETASATAIARLGELGFTIQLKEVGNNTKTTTDDGVVYELTGNKQGKFLGIFKIIASEKVQVDAETGEVKKVIKPWWSFLATGI